MKAVQVIVSRHNHQSETSSVQITDELLITLLRLAGIAVPDTANVTVEGMVVSSLTPIEVSWTETLQSDTTKTVKHHDLPNEDMTL